MKVRNIKMGNVLNFKANRTADKKFFDGLQSIVDVALSLIPDLGISVQLNPVVSAKKSGNGHKTIFKLQKQDDVLLTLGDTELRRVDVNMGNKDIAETDNFLLQASKSAIQLAYEESDSEINCYDKDDKRITSDFAKVLLSTGIVAEKSSESSQFTGKYSLSKLGETNFASVRAEAEKVVRIYGVKQPEPKLDENGNLIESSDSDKGAKTSNWQFALCRVASCGITKNESIKIHNDETVLPICGEHGERLTRDVSEIK